MRRTWTVVVWSALALVFGCPTHTEVMGDPGDDPDGPPDGPADDDDDTTLDEPDVPPLPVDHAIPAFPPGPCEDYEGVVSFAEIWSTPRENPALERLALSLEPQRLVVSDATYERVVADVTAIRAQEPDLEHIEYLPLHDGERLFLHAEEDVRARMVSGEYDAWACPNLYYVVTQIADINLAVVVRFKGAYNMHLLEQIYAPMPDVEWVQSNTAVGDGPTICTEQDGDLMHYVFDDASGDCPAGCIDHEFTYYTVDGGGAVTRIGEWATSSEDPEPAWVSLCDYDPEVAGD